MGAPTAPVGQGHPSSELAPSRGGGQWDTLRPLTRMTGQLPNYEHVPKFGLSQIFYGLRYLCLMNPMYLAEAKSEPVAGSDRYTL